MNTAQAMGELRLSVSESRRADLRGANLWGADLPYANLRGADLRGADLRDANMPYASLQNANLRGADMSYANLQNANLRGADLRNADLQNANLQGADLPYANLQNANLRGVRLPSPTAVLLALWGTCSASLTIELMRYDAANHPNPRSFDVWGVTGACPYRSCSVQRAANFREAQELWPGWNPRKKVKSAYQLMCLLLEEKTKNQQKEPQ